MFRATTGQQAKITVCIDCQSLGDAQQKHFFFFICRKKYTHKREGKRAAALQLSFLTDAIGRKKKKVPYKFCFFSFEVAYFVIALVCHVVVCIVDDLLLPQEK